MHEVAYTGRLRNYVSGTEAGQSGALRFDVYDAQSFGDRRKYEGVHGLVQFRDIGTLSKQLHASIQVLFDNSTFNFVT
jgi:hypothetical protein